MFCMCEWMNIKHAELNCVVLYVSLCDDRAENLYDIHGEQSNVA